MKRIFIISMSYFLLYSCATAPLPPFNKEKNCSPRALQRINQAKTVQLTGSSNTDTFRAVQNCYRSIRMEVGYTESHNICLVLAITKNGGFNFLDVSDQERPMGTEFQKCIVDKLAKIDFSDFKDQIILQSLRTEYSN